MVKHAAFPLTADVWVRYKQGKLKVPGTSQPCAKGPDTDMQKLLQLLPDVCNCSDLEKAHTTSHLKSCQHLLKFLPKVAPSSTSILSLVLNYSCYFTSLTKSLLSAQLKSKAQRRQLWPTSLPTSPNCPETRVISTPLLQVFSILHWSQDRQRQGEQACLTFSSFPLQFNCPWSQKKGERRKTGLYIELHNRQNQNCLPKGHWERVSQLGQK